MFQLPAAAFRRDMSKVTLNAVKSIESLPLAMRNDPKVADAISKDLLQCITFSFESIIAVGLHHPIEPTNDQVRCALKTLQRIPRQTNKAPALCPYEPSHIDDFNDMRDHLKEYSQPLYHYYSSRTNRAMTIWNSTISPEYLPGHLVPTEITFRDLDYWAITHTYGITYEAQTVLAMVETLSQTAVEMTAIEGVGYV